MDLVNDLPHEGAGLHVVVGILEDIVDHLGTAAEVVIGEDELVLEVGKEFVVDEGAEAIAGQAFGVGGPVAPAKALGDGGLIVVF